MNLEICPNCKKEKKHWIEDKKCFLDFCKKCALEDRQRNRKKQYVIKKSLERICHDCKIKFLSNCKHKFCAKCASIQQVKKANEKWISAVPKKIKVERKKINFSRFKLKSIYEDEE